MKIQFVISLLLLLSAINSDACTYHDSFNSNAMVQFNPSVRKPMQIPQWIEIRVNHHQKIAVKTGTDLQLQLQLRYFVPLEYAHTVASDTVSKDLNILAKLPLGLAKSLGSTHTIFRASLASEHSLSIASDTTLSNKPDSKIQQRCHLQ